MFEPIYLDNTITVVRRAKCHVEAIQRKVLRSSINGYGNNRKTKEKYEKSQPKSPSHQPGQRSNPSNSFEVSALSHALRDISVNLVNFLW